MKLIDINILKQGITLACFVTLSCNNQSIENLNPENSDLSGICGVQNPMEQINWLKDEIEIYNTSESYNYIEIIIYQAIYIDMPVFITTICCPNCCIAPPAIRNCRGEILGYLGTDADYSILDNATIIWRTHNGICW